MMYLPDKNLIKKLLIWLIVLVFIIAIADITYIFFSNRKKDNDTAVLTENFLSYVQNGDIQAAEEIWPAVYTAKKNDIKFLNSFSNVLNDVYIKYYSDTYINDSSNESMYEICRIFHSFLNIDNFNSAASSVLDDYLNEIITFQSFITAANDYFLFSGYSSSHIRSVIDKGILLNDSRNIYYKAEEAAELKEYSYAIELMRMVSTFDSLYYPKSILKIDEYILLLTEEVKNGS